MLDHASPSVQGLAALKRLSGLAAALPATWPEMNWPRQAAILRTLIVRVELHDERVDIQLAASRVATLLTRGPETPIASRPADAECLTCRLQPGSDGSGGEAR